MLLFFVVFFHTLVKHGHRAPDYRLQNHIHTVLSKETHRHDCSRGQEGGSLVSWRMHPRVDTPPLSCPGLVKLPFFFFFFFFLFYFGKSKFVKPQIQTRTPPPTNEHFPSGRRHECHQVTFWDRPANLSLPLTFQIPPPLKKKQNKKPKPGKWHPWLPSAWCWTWIHTWTCLLRGVSVCRSYRPTCGVCVNAYRAGRKGLGVELKGGRLKRGEVVST